MPFSLLLKNYFWSPSSVLEITIKMEMIHVCNGLSSNDWIKRQRRSQNCPSNMLLIAFILFPLEIAFLLWNRAFWHPTSLWDYTPQWSPTFPDGLECFLTYFFYNLDIVNLLDLKLNFYIFSLKGLYSLDLYLLDGKWHI